MSINAFAMSLFSKKQDLAAVEYTPPPTHPTSPPKNPNEYHPFFLTLLRRHFYYEGEFEKFLAHEHGALVLILILNIGQGSWNL